MNLANRIRQLIAAPQQEWQAISNENTPAAELLTKYLLVLAAIPAVASFVGYGLTGISMGRMGQIGGGISFGIKQGLVSYISSIASVYLAAWVINYLAPSFGSRQNFDKAFGLVAYAYTPTLIAGIVLIIPSLSLIPLLAGLYGLYLLFLGLSPMMETPVERRPAYFIASLLVMILASILISSLFALIFVRSFF